MNDASAMFVPDGLAADDSLDPSTAIAIVGMAGRFPGAPDVDALWRLVRDGEDGLSDLSEQDLRAAGVDEATMAEPDYVRRTGGLADLDCFDAAFFGIGPRDAAIMDPQHRHFYECAWAALEAAGHVPERFDGAIGVFGGCGHNTYLLHNLLTSPGLLDSLGWFLLRHTGNDKDFLTTGVSYRLDLHGPSINVQTACSTSLVAIHLAVQSLLSLECDMALAGGSTIEVPAGVGYTYHEGEVLSPDGRCHAFDEQSRGTVLTSGVGVVALRRLSDAISGGDPVLAVIRGSAVNNDGSRKVGYLAPSVDGHAAVVREALAVAGVDAGTVTLLEAHGTGTRVGDPIELAALTAAFRDTTDATGFCRLTSTKPNIGHLDTAAGVASVIKVVQAMRHRYLPPMAGYTAPNELLDLDATPFVLSGKGAEWDTVALPRRAGISSLGVGGTNAHVVLEQAPAPPPTDPAPGPHLLLVSARTEAAADLAALRLAGHLDAPAIDGLDEDLADVAHTLAVGRRRFLHRRAVVAQSDDEAAARLRGAERARLSRGVAGAEAREVILALPGGGSQYPGMSGGLLVADGRFATFRATLSEAIEEVQARSGLDLRPLLARTSSDDQRDAALRQPAAALPAVLAVEIALARQLFAWGIRPRALVGHSLGEYAAAHLAGVLSLGDVVELVVRRAELMARVSAQGVAMATVSLGEAGLAPQLGEVSLAVVNAPDECVVSGRADAVDALLERLTAQGIDTHRIPLAAAAHSSLLDPILAEFADVVRSVTLLPPTMPYVSNLTGTWITAEQATDPDAWVRHLRGTVRFSDGLATALEAGPAAVVEVGPGRTLSSYARSQPSRPVAVPTLRHVNDATPDDVHLIGAMGQLWVAGVDAEWPAVVTTPGRRRRVPLPTYPFERTRHWIEAGERPLARAAAGAAAGVAAQPGSVASTLPERLPADQWASAPTWALLGPLAPVSPAAERWIMVADDVGAAVPTQLAAALRREGRDVRIVANDSAVRASAGADAVVIVGSVDDDGAAPEQALARAQERWLGSAVDVLRVVAERDGTRIGLVTIGAWTLTGDGPGRATEALAIGPATVARTEFPGLRSSAVDLAAQPTAEDIAAAAAELVAGDRAVVAVRAGQRYGLELEPLGLPAPSADAEASMTVGPGTTWLITGGLGGIGTALARHLAERGCSLVLTVSSPLPDDPAAWRLRHGPAHPTAVRLNRLEALRATGAAVRVEVCDLADPADVRSMFNRLHGENVHVDGAVHAAGVLVDRPLALLDADEVEVVVGAKARGAVVLADELERRGGATLVLASSTSTLVAAGGQAAYVSANGVLDALAGRRGTLDVVTLQWGVWAGEGMAVLAAERASDGITSVVALDHPVLHEVGTDRAGAAYVRGALTTGVWSVDQHRLDDGTALLPGTGAVELLLAALDAAGEPQAAVIDLLLMAPLVVVDGTTVPVRIVIAAPGQPRRQIRLDADPTCDGTWRTYVEGTVGAPAPLARALPATDSDRAARFPDPVPDLLAGPETQLRLGPRWQVARTALRNADEVIATVEPPADDEGWRFDPAVGDLAVAAGVALPPTGGLWVPAAITAASLAAAAGPARLVHARRAAKPRPADADTAVVDLLIATAEGTTLALIDGLTLRRLPAASELVLPSPETGLPPPVTDNWRRSGAPFLALAMNGGIRPDEGAEQFARVLASGAHRVVVSSIALSALIALSPVAVEAPSSGAAARGGTLDVVTALWEQLLGIDGIGPDDDFFELGGHSLIAVRVVAAVHRELQVRLGLSALVEAPTPAELAAMIDAALVTTAPPSTAVPLAATVAAASSTTPPSLVPLRPQGTKRPFFIVHGAGGNVLNLQGLARQLDSNRPVWGLQAHGVNGQDTPDPTVEAMATRYLDAVRKVQPRGPYLLGGYSGGGIVALEMSRQLAQFGDRVDLAMLFDTYKPHFDSSTPLEKAWSMAQNIREHGLRTMITPAWLRGVAHRRLARIGLAIADMTDVDMPVEVDLFFAFEGAVRGYRYGQYPTSVVLLRAAPQRPTFHPDYSWQNNLSGFFEEYRVPGDHLTLFAPEYTPALAATVTEALNRADQAEARGHSDRSHGA